MDLTQVISIINTSIFLATCAGAFLTFRNARKAEIMNIQSKTIDALKEQVSVIQTKQKALEEKNARLEQVIETIQQALKQRGMIISIDGELVTITDTHGTNSSYRKRQPKTLPVPDGKEKP